MLGAALVVWGFGRGAQPLSDNSLLTHIATGRIVVESGVPTTDPYSWTAAGAPYVAQSWLVSWVFGMVEGLGDGVGIRLVGGVVGAAVAWMAWLLSRPARGLLVRFGLVGSAIAVETAFLVPRPAAFGLVGVGLTLLALYGTEWGTGRTQWHLPAPWLALVGAVWVNVHGSWAVALGVCVAVAVGRLVDRDDPWPALVAGGWLSTGVMAGALVSPVGWDLVSFPALFLSRSDDLRHLYEFQSYRFDDAWQLAGVVVVALGVVGLVRSPRWAAILPVAGLVVAAVSVQRNAAVAALVIVAAAAPGLSGLGSIEGRARGMASLVASVVAATAMVVVLVGVALDDPYDLDDYPVELLARAESAGLVSQSQRPFHPDFVGNVFELVYGPRNAVFVDDRVEFYPPIVIDALFEIGRGDDAALDRLDELEVGVVIYPEGTTLSEALDGSAGWRRWAEAPTGDGEPWALWCRPERSCP